MKNTHKYTLHWIYDESSVRMNNAGNFSEHRIRYLISRLGNLIGIHSVKSDKTETLDTWYNIQKYILNVDHDYFS